MANFYNDAVKILIDDGWTKVNPACFTKANFEVFFDTSHYVEINNVDEKKCLYASPLESNDEFKQLLTNVKQIYKLNNQP